MAAGPKGTASRKASPAPLATASGAVSTRGRKTRAALVLASRVVFERDGFLDARIVDICAEANVAAGSFYTHFDDKKAIFRALVDEVGVEMLEPVVDAEGHDESAADRVKRNNLSYFEAYKKNWRLMALFEEMSLIDETFRQLRLTRARAFSERNALVVRRLQATGQVDPTLDALLIAESLSAMVSRMAQLTFVWGQSSDMTALVDAVSHVWCSVLGLNTGPDPERPTQGD